MSISTDDIIQSATGTFNATSGTATLPGGTTDGNTVWLCVMTFGTSAPLVTGFTRDHGGAVSSAKSYVLRQSNVTAGTSSWSITGFGSAQPTVWFAFEIQGLARIGQPECNSLISGASFVGATSIASATTPASTLYEGLVLAFHGGQNVSSATIPTWSGQTNDFVEYVENSIVVGSTATSAAVSFYHAVDISAGYQCTATASIAVTASAVVVVYAPAGAHRIPNPDLIMGFETGTIAGWTTGNTACPPVDVVVGTPAIVSTSPRTGTYCLELAATTAAESIAWTTTGALSLYPAPSGFTAFRQYVARVSFYFPTSLPASDVAVMDMTTGSGASLNGVTATFRVATGQLGVAVSEASHGTGTEVLSTATLVANTWYSLDIAIDMDNGDRSLGGLWFSDWALDGVAQTQAVKSTTTTGANATISQLRLGWLTSTTATIRYDDVVGTKHPGHYPLGDIGIYPLGVDPAGTVTLSGTTGNFNTFTSNGTLAAWNATTARNNIDEIPATIGASADGFAQITVAASDYVEVPMLTRSGATNYETIRGVRWYFPGWAASTTAATIGMRGFDGTTETVLLAAADPNFDNSTTTPAWVCRMHRALASSTPYIWTQAQLDALTARVGFSTGATPDIGVHAILAEVAMRRAYEQQVLEASGVIIYARLDPDTGNIIAMRLVAPVAGDAWALYTVNGVDVNRTATAGTEDVYYIGAESNAVVSFWTGGLS